MSRFAPVDTKGNRVQDQPPRYQVGAMATKSGTVAIGPEQGAGTFYAVRFANESGRPLNLHVTIDFSSLGIDPENAAVLFREIWQRFTRWYAYQRDQKAREFGPFDAYAVHEHPEHGPRHVHWVMRAPEGTRAEIERVIRSRVEKLTGFACLGRSVHFQEVGAAGQLTKYTMKGMQPAAAHLYHVRPSNQGFVSGRRLTVSRSIGRAARKRAGWTRKRTR